MENVNYRKSEEKLVGRLTMSFVAGIVMSAVAIVLFFVGAYGAARNPLWISTAVIGGISILLLAITAHSTDGWYRMFSVFFMEVLIVLGTIMAVSVV